ncbi:unnamed protein product [Sympodiomycopsis kandeliae]
MASTADSNGRSSSSSKADMYGSYGPFGPVFQIIPGVQNYDWGILGKNNSLVGVYAEATEQLKAKIEPEKPYAELWMGSHPTLPSTIVPPPGCPQPPSSADKSNTFISLSSYLNRHEALLGKQVVAQYGTGLTRGGGQTTSDGKKKDQGALPFLFKILSAGKALSIQAHPDKALAEKLHKENPKSYKDDNHKPEMAIALTDFKGFCGFRPLSEIVHFLDVVPEFKGLVRPSDAFIAEVSYASKESSGTTEEETKDYLRRIFSPLMKAAMTDVKRATMGISQRYAAELSKEDNDEREIEISEDLARLVCTLNEQFPGDVGVFCTFMLNVVVLQPGQAMFLKANEPHAYISGNIVECMAASDNVVRAGLTPKERDVDVLIDMLTYNSGPSDTQLMHPKPFLPDSESKNVDEYKGFTKDSELALDVASPSGAKRQDEASHLPSLLYDPPIDEFSVVMTRLRGGQSELQRAIDGPSILMLTSGKGRLISHPTPQENLDESVSEEVKDIIKSREFAMDKAGKVFFVGAGVKVEIVADDDSEGQNENLSVARAFVEVQ